MHDDSAARDANPPEKLGRAADRAGWDGDYGVREIFWEINEATSGRRAEAVVKYSKVRWEQGGWIRTASHAERLFVEQLNRLRI